MLNWRQLMIETFVEQLQIAYRRSYSKLDREFGDIVAWSGRLALENISNSDALYHDMEHTIMVTLAGLAIVEGKHLREGGVDPRDWMHFLIALLCHDIGYVKGVCRNDTKDSFATGNGDETAALPLGGTDIVLTPYHVDRSKLFVRERFGSGLIKNMTESLDAELIASFIEMTRFPSPDTDFYKDTRGYGGLVRAADFIGQLGDPGQLRKAPALFYEFEEIGANLKFGYRSPEDIRAKYAKFYWEMVNPYIQDALGYLRLTQEGKQWIANMQSHVFESEHGTNG
jgi:hypothetical protein